VGLYEWERIEKREVNSIQFALHVSYQQAKCRCPMPMLYHFPF
jgi:hypothetical protein